MNNMETIPSTIATKLCGEIRQKSKTQWHSLAARWCWLCERGAKGDPLMMGFSRRGDNRGCPQINAHYAETYSNQLKSS